ncbi:MAG TPA: hypothetical protein VNA69_18850 [Thermoanaerobaculia bacterium]|nr:hypothetical protein [Thermoanaerobaculia bacterium]
MEGTELRARRLRIGCSRNQVAHALGVAVPVLQAWEDDGVRIEFPAAAEQVLRKLERRDEESEIRSHVN